MGKKMKSLPPNLSIDDVTINNAISIISMPSSLGKMPESQDDILIDIGRYGPYLRAGKKNCSIPKDMNILEIELKDAIKLLQSSKKGGSEIIKELGQDNNNNDIVIKNGRYGKFITNGKVNAPMPKNITDNELTLDEAIKILSTRKPKKFKYKKK